MNKEHQEIHNLIQSVRQLKGPHGNIELSAEHWYPDNKYGTRGLIMSRGICPAGTPGNEKPVQDYLDPPGNDKPDPSSESEPDCDGSLKVGEMVAFSGISYRTGYVHLFNFGTSGTCLKLAPSREYPDNRVVAGEKFRLPSESLLSSRELRAEGFPVDGPVSPVYGQPERLMVIVTSDDIDIQVKDLNPKLTGRDLLTRCASRGAGFSMPPRKDVSKIFQLEPGKWDFGLLEMDVME